MWKIIYFFITKRAEARIFFLFRDKQNCKNNIMIMDGVINITLEVKDIFFPCHMSEFQFIKNYIF